MLPHWTQNDIIANGIRIHYYRTGPGSEGKPSLVLAHGFSDNGLCWLRVSRDLQDEWDVILPDARGHGLSQRLKPGEKVDMSADLAGLIQVLELDHPVVGGHSMGAGTAALMDARFPGLARALILEDPGWRAAEPPSPTVPAAKEPPPNLFAERLKRMKEKTLEEVIAEGRANTPTWEEIEWPAWGQSKLQFDFTFFETEGTSRDWTEVVRGIRCPALLITADPEKDAIVTPEIARQAAALSSFIQVVKIPGAGHNIRRENYPAFIEAVRGFLK